MATFDTALDQLRENQPPGRYGIAFEKLMVNYFRSDPVLSAEYADVCRWIDWPYNGGNPDTGIDLVARRAEDLQWVAIQCKFYKRTTSIQKAHLDSFFEASGRTFTTEHGTESFAQRIIISTTDKWSKNAEAMLENQGIPTNRIGTAAIADAPIDWDLTFPGSDIEINLSPRHTFEPRPHQATAIAKTIEGFNTHDRGKLIMACGTGKTFTALRLAEQVAELNGNRARVLFLVPSISLLSQTLKEWTAQARLDLKSYAVCSDTKVSKKAEDIASYDLEVPVSTNGADVAERFSHGKRAAGLQVVFSTYQSLPAVHEAQAAGLDDFDLVICDEAHRTTGVTLAGEDASNFVRIHDADYIRAARRLYMTATPRLFDDATKGKAAEHSAELASMDDEAVYGPEFHRLGFGEAVEKGLLTDYKVLVMTVDEEVAAEALSRGPQEVNLSLASAMIGAWNGLAKRSGKEQGTKHGFDIDAAPMKRTVVFAKDIKTSKQIVESYPTLVATHQQLLREKAALNEVSLHNVDLEIAARHVDGAMNAMERNSRLSWLEADVPENQTRVLSNARCLSEGVDVPALDAVVFFNPRNSMVDVVQSVGRVMRKSEGKDYGYIILPVAVPPGKSPSEVLSDNRRFKVVWQILNALRAHDDRFNAKVNSISLNESAPDELPIDVEHVDNPNKSDRQKLDEAEQSGARTAALDSADEVTAQTLALFSLEQWQEALYTKLVDKVGTRTYWEDWADDVADIADAQTARIRSLLEGADAALRKEFEAFVEGLRGNLNDSISEDEAIGMLSQHLITAPVFNALFAEYDFAAHNPVSRVMQRMVDALADKRLESETEGLEKFYESVRVRASEVTSASGKQQVVKELYERFFRKAFKKQAEALGIVYTPVEIVDFILRSADDLLKKHFGRGLTDEGVHVLDPFTGTGTFMVRLLQSGLIEPEDLARKYAKELHATEIMLLAYYVGAVNIETTYNALMAERAQRNADSLSGSSEQDSGAQYVLFEGIALADTFQVYEEGDALDLDVFVENNAAIERQKQAPIHVIVGNPPYSVGQTSANDNNANLKYPTLDQRIAQTYVAKSTGARKSQLYDSYLRAFCWATDRIGNHGIVAFVSNGGWLDGNTADGVRLSFAEDFSDIYVFDLRGNARTAGELRRKEAGNVFRDGGRTTIAVTLCVKDPKRSGCTIHYRDIGDYLSAEEKLDIVQHASIESLPWEEIKPNKFGDWLSQRSELFETWPVLGDKKDTQVKKFSENYSLGLATNRDAWAYNFSLSKLEQNIRCAIKFYNSETRRLTGLVGQGKSEDEARKEITFDKTKFSWDRVNKRNVVRGRYLDQRTDAYRIGLYRPFTKNHVYFDQEQQLNNCTYRMPQMFPTPEHDNIGFAVVNPGESTGLSVLATDKIPDLHLIASSQFFSRWTWERVEVSDSELDLALGQSSSASIKGREGEILSGYRRVDNVTDEILAQYRSALGDVTKDDIFHFAYGQLHDPAYRAKYAADLKKMLPHIATPQSREPFDQVAAAGQALMALHVGYEDVEPYPLDVQIKEGFSEDDRETWRVAKMKWAKRKDSETAKTANDVTKIIYNTKVTISGIPAEAGNYILGSRSALAWVIDRYQVKKDKASGIVNDPNDWADEVGNPRYIVDLIRKVTRVAVETVQIVKQLEISHWNTQDVR
ncbi:DEAD/DEAH box helicase [Corynebacterium heidelbergense]|uniref:Damage-inducible protein n=1 Tax=Corynebacterium heidelbergense TaxID=2055947 RepID=A0A364VCW9_9CORY|nr:DEAD/DEAH box helicase [Corynebacterium heidelbergense]RAV34493.1 damage-inducible protein [Corynebacterium heidelbergense]